MTDARLLPELWPLHLIGKELGKSTQVLVEASSRGEFPPVVRIGATWHVKADLMREWLERQHAPQMVSQAHVERMQAAARAAVSRPRGRRQLQPRARTASSS